GTYPVAMSCRLYCERAECDGAKTENGSNCGSVPLRGCCSCGGYRDLSAISQQTPGSIMGAQQVRHGSFSCLRVDFGRTAVSVRRRNVCRSSRFALMEIVGLVVHYSVVRNRWLRRCG